MSSMLRPSIKLNGDSELLCLAVESPEMRLEIGYLFGTHSENSLYLDNLPMLTSNMTTAPRPSEFIVLGKNNHRGNGSSEIMKLMVPRRWPYLELIEQRVYIRYLYPFIVMHFSPTEQKRKKKAPNP